MGAHELLVIGGLVIGGALALVGLFNPFLGVLVFLTLHFLQPGELVPALEPFRIELVYGLALLGSVGIHLAVDHDHPALFSNPVPRAALLLVFANALTIPFAVWKGGAAQWTVEMVKLVALVFFLHLLINTHARLRQLVWVLIVLLTWFTISGFVAYLHGEVYHEGVVERAQGITSIAGGPNALASLILALLPFLVLAFRCHRGILVRLFLVACGGLAVATITITGARAVMLSLVCVVLYYILRSRHKLASVAFFLILAVATWTAMPERYRQRYLTVEQYARGGELDASNQLRVHIWEVGWRMFVGHPLLGVGAGQFPTAYGTIYASRLHQPWMNPHNLLIQVACEMGVVGLIVFAYFLVQIIKQIRSVPDVRGQPDLELSYQVSIACGAMFLGVIAVSFVGHTLYRPYWYLLGGLASANHSLAQRLLAARAEAGEETETGTPPTASLTPEEAVAGERPPLPRF